MWNTAVHVARIKAWMLRRSEDLVFGVVAAYGGDTKPILKELVH
jgi:hypothetical protein